MTPEIETLRRALPVAALLALGACTQAPSVDDRGEWLPGATMAAESFSGERAWAHLLALSELGPRPSGSAAAQEAFEYLRSRLESSPKLQAFELVLPQPDAEAAGADAAAGAKAADSGPLARHLVARLPGASPDSILLLAHYDTLAGSPGANDGASGAAVLLELARQLAERPLHYTVEIVFLDNEMGIDEKKPTTPLLQGSQLLAERLRDDGTLDEVRLVLALRQVGDAELTIGRDLLSHRIHRETFFEAAADLGLGAAFPTNRGFVELVASHTPFRAVGMPRGVALMDPWYGGDPPPGTFWGGEADTPERCSEDSLRAVGVVALAGLRRISEQLQKIDLVSGRAARRRGEILEPAQAMPAEEVLEEAPDPSEGASPAPGGGLEAEEPPAEAPSGATEEAVPAPESS